MNITTIKQNSSYTEIINKSKFIAYSFCLQSFEQIDTFLQETKQKYADATHICYAYKFFGNEKAVDNGEPQGTAGKPILECIKKQNLSNVLVVVVRYFGGIKLGAGGLTRAYGNLAQKVIAISDTKQIFECKKIEFCLPITESKKLTYLSNMYDIFEPKFEYGQVIKITLYCQTNQVEQTAQKIENIFSQKINFEVSEQVFLI